MVFFVLVVDFFVCLFVFQEQGIVPAQASFLFLPTCFGLWECYKMRWSDPVLKSYRIFFFP